MYNNLSKSNFPISLNSFIYDVDLNEVKIEKLKELNGTIYHRDYLIDLNKLLTSLKENDNFKEYFKNKSIKELNETIFKSKEFNEFAISFYNYHIKKLFNLFLNAINKYLNIKNIENTNNDNFDIIIDKLYQYFKVKKFLNKKNSKDILKFRGGVTPPLNGKFTPF